uniref:protein MICRORCHIDIA 7-like n=1 Tax=Erigeron canadensis TaxID=72917 RepID=UPI001CB9D0CF|nr:protein MICRORCHIDIA 7-like [Erigeron canadensis]
MEEQHQIRVKQEILEQQHIDTNNAYTSQPGSSKRKPGSNTPVAVVDLDTAGSDSDSEKTESFCPGDNYGSNKRQKNGNNVVLPDGFLDPLPPKNKNVDTGSDPGRVKVKGCNKQFWKAGDFELGSGGNWETSSGCMDHVRVHPRFLHSNATSHKWVLGAFAELLDNSLDEVCNGATYVSIDMLRNKKDKSKMLVIEDNGGGMDPDKMRQCMSLGYSLKSKVADTIGQYGNGFKTSTMRLGADVIVFSRCSAKGGKRSTQSIGLLSYTFLRSTGKEDIVVPMVDYKREGRECKKIIRSSQEDWDTNIEAVVQWSPFSSEADLLKQFDFMKDQGTRLIIYNLWEDDQGQLELDFDTAEDDVQIRGVNRDEKNIQMASAYPNSKAFLTYRHSLRTYSSILYLRIPPGFRMILRGKDVQHHNIVNDMMMTTEVTYRPQPGADGLSKDSNIVAVVTMGFVKDAKAHIDVQGYNVYHKNRLIKPFWRLWNSTGSDGRGVIGVLEANFVEPAHDKQGFERTIVLSRLETRLIQMQKTYWRTYCHRIGYAPRINKNNLENDTPPDFSPEATKKKKAASTKQVSLSNKFFSNKNPKLGGSNLGRQPAVNRFEENGQYGEGPSSLKSTSKTEIIRDTTNIRHTNLDNGYSPYGNTMEIVTHYQSMFQDIAENGSDTLHSSVPDLSQLAEENRQLKEKLKKKDEDILGDLLRDIEKEKNRCKELEAQLEEAKEKSETVSKEQESMIDIFADERERRDREEQILRKKLKEATTTIQDLVERVKQLELEKMKSQKWTAT